MNDTKKHVKNIDNQLFMSFHSVYLPRKKQKKRKDMTNEQFDKLYSALTGLATMQVKEVLNMDDVILLTGLSKSTIYKLVWAQKIPYYKDPMGKNLHFKKSEIESWLLTHRTPTAAEIAEQARAYCVSNPR